ncbi:MAG TPA: alpha/beta fold hydrolase [Iamia sp.]|jgi:pimeloyl-ACP methyl ester carboxylesterase|nr:alpha/beta fold hydrolase [Iamia sp.]
MSRRPLSALVAVVLVLGACSSSDGEDDADDTTTTTSSPESTTEDPAADLPPVEASELVEVPCWWELPDDAPEGVTITCGTVDVPSDPADPDSDSITLAVARLHGSGDPAAEPVISLHGGPGGDSLSDPPTGLMALDILDERDVITFDQRGAGRSLPSLNCPEKEEAILDTLGAAESWDVEYAANLEAVEACYQRLTEDEGIDLDQYDTPASVRDIEVLRETFGVEAWNVWGASYGTRLGLDYARAHPDRVRSLVIDSVYAPDVGGVDYVKGLPQGALDRLVEACAAEEACAGAYGDLGTVLEDATAAMDADPEELTANVTLGGEEVERDFVLTGSDVRAGLFAALYDSELIPVLPSVIAAVASGDRSIVPQFVDVGVPRLLDLSEGAFYSVDCADSGRALEGTDVQAELAEATEDALIALNAAQVFCADWPVEHVPEAFNEPVTVDVPTLVYGGTLDPITPFTHSEAQAEIMPDARFVTVPNAGHGAAGTNDCTKSARDGFWRDPDADLPACLDDLVAPPFVVGG